MDNLIIRKIKKGDNQEVAKLIRDVLDELNIPKVGTAYEDPYLDLMFEEYNKPKSVYYVVENEGRIVGWSRSGAIGKRSADLLRTAKNVFSAGNSRKGDREQNDGAMPAKCPRIWFRKMLSGNNAFYAGCAKVI